MNRTLFLLSLIGAGCANSDCKPSLYDADCDGHESKASGGADCADTDADIHPGAAELADGVDQDCDGLVDEGTDIYDDDADGFTEAQGDCNDSSREVAPGAAERCDGLDQDCDGQVDEDAQGTWYADGDGDGHGDAAQPTLDCDPPEGYVSRDDDCDDNDAAVFPDAPEVCDGVDQDCDVDVDEETLLTFYADADEDGYGDLAVDLEACEAPEGYVDDSSDCDDRRADVHPESEELCDEVDQDCDGLVDEEVAPTWYRDGDGDGYGDEYTSTVDCFAPTDYVSNADDCDDGDDQSYPGAEELCGDRIIQDCGMSPAAATALCQPSGTRSLANADIVLQGVSGLVHHGAIVGLGDVSGDGFDDVAVSDGDSAWVFEGPLSPGTYIDTDAATTLSTGLSFGALAAGDFDGDGQGDVAVGSDEGDAVYLFFGSLMPQMNPGDADVVLSGAEGTGFGRDISAGDVDGDGVTDLLIGANVGSPLSVDSDGHAFLVMGPVTADRSVSASSDRLLAAPSGAGGVGWEVEAGCDFDGDGYDDPVLSAYASDNPGYDAGEVFVLSGASLSTGSGTTTLGSTGWTLDGDPYDYAGRGLACGDINDDNVDDLVVGASRSVAGGASEGGAVYILDGSTLANASLSSLASATWTGQETNGWVGFSVAVIDDVNGYRGADVLIGAPGEYSNAGRTYLLYDASANGGALSSTSADLILQGVGNIQWTGNAVSSAGDANGDGFDDLMIAPMSRPYDAYIVNGMGY